jgi:hypothetical protein
MQQCYMPYGRQNNNSPEAGVRIYGQQQGQRTCGTDAHAKMGLRSVVAESLLVQRMVHDAPVAFSPVVELASSYPSQWMNRPVPISVFSDQYRTKSTTRSRTSCGTHTLVRAPQDFF